MRIQVRSMLLIMVMTAGLALQGACSKKEPAPDTTPPADQEAERETETEAVAVQETPVKQAAVKPIPTPQPKVVEATPPKKNKPEPTVLMETPAVSISAMPMDPATSVQYLVANGWNEIRSVSAKVNTSYDQLGGNEERRHKGEGVSDFVRDGAQVRTVSRLGSFMKHEADVDDAILITGQKLTRYSDGPYMYTITERKLGTVVTKRFANHIQIKYLGGAKMFAFIRALKNLRELPGESVDGKYTYVLEGELPRYHLKYRHYIDEETGILMKMVVENSAIQSTSVTEFSNIEINIEFPEGHFDFKPPDGVEVQDLTIPGAKLKSPTPRKDEATVDDEP